MTFINKNNAAFFLIFCYFLMAFIEIVSELLYQSPIPFVKISFSILLILLYSIKTNKHDVVFYLIVLFLMITTIFFSFNSYTLFVLGLISFILNRILAIYLIFKLSFIKDYKQIIISTLPFLFIFTYLITITNEIPLLDLYLLIVQSLLISVLGGVSLSLYLKNENRQNSWLLISTLLFIGLRFIVFIERFYLENITLTVIRPIGTLLSVFAFFTFYKFVIAAENNENITI